MQRQVLVLEEKYKDIAQLKTMKEQVEELKKERVWAEVIATEKVLALGWNNDNNNKVGITLRVTPSWAHVLYQIGGKQKYLSKNVTLLKPCVHPVQD